MYHIKRLYHQIMIWYYALKTKYLIRKMRKLSKTHNLPSLDAYTDEQIVEGIKQSHHKCCNQSSVYNRLRTQNNNN